MSANGKGKRQGVHPRILRMLASAEHVHLFNHSWEVAAVAPEDDREVALLHSKKKLQQAQANGNADGGLNMPGLLWNAARALKICRTDMYETEDIIPV